MRRTKRRMALQGLTGLDAYAAYLRKTPSEIRALGADFLIKVTEFFREPQAWLALEQQVLPKITESLVLGEPLRIWVAGCATGEEAYSMGITLLELMSKGGLSIKLNIIGSDLDPVIPRSRPDRHLSRKHYRGIKARIAGALFHQRRWRPVPGAQGIARIGHVFPAQSPGRSALFPYEPRQLP